MKKVFLTAIMCFLISFTACSNANSKSDSMATQETDLSETVFDKSAPADTYFPEYTASDINIVPSCIVNLSADAELAKVTLNNIEVDIETVVLRDILNATGLDCCDYGTTDLQLEDFVFTSGMYGVQADKTDMFSFGTTVGIEVVDENGSIVYNDSNIDKNLCNVKGVHISDFFVSDDFEVIFYGGIKCGITDIEVYDILGSEGQVSGKQHMYNNGKQTIVVEIEDGCVNEITLLNN